MRRARIFLCFIFAISAAAQNAPWTSQVRGSWVQRGSPAAGDITLAAKGMVSQIVVSEAENSAVHQAANFLAGDIEKISGYRPAIVKSATAGNTSIRLIAGTTRAGFGRRGV